MKEIIINVPDDSVEFVEELVERMGCTIKVPKNKIKATGKAKGKEHKPLDFFGTWPDIPMDPKTYRKNLWRKIPEF